MDDQADVAAELVEELPHRRLVADVDGDMAIGRVGALQLAAVPVRRCGRPEEVLAHVVVDADDLKALVGEEAHRLRADQPGRAGHQYDVSHVGRPFRVLGACPLAFSGNPQ